MDIENSIGKQLKRIDHGDLVIDGYPEDEDIGPIEFIFSDKSTLHLEIGDDGESVSSKWVQFNNNTIGWRNHLLPRHNLPSGKFEDQTIIETDLLYFGLLENSRDKDIVVGYGFKLVNGLVIIFYNAGNFAKLYFNGFPPDLPNECVLRWDKNTLK
jgi:hypothetical protein